MRYRKSGVTYCGPGANKTAWFSEGKPRHAFYSGRIISSHLVWSDFALNCEGIWRSAVEATPGVEIVCGSPSPYFAATDFPITRAIFLDGVPRYALVEPAPVGPLSEDQW